MVLAEPARGNNISDRTTEYRWYLTGCNRLGYDPLPYEEFATLWQRYEDHAESLQAAETAGRLTELDAADRKQMEAEVRTSAIMKAVLVGQSEEA